MLESTRGIRPSGLRPQRRAFDTWLTDPCRVALGWMTAKSGRRAAPGCMSRRISTGQRGSSNAPRRCSVICASRDTSKFLTSQEFHDVRLVFHSAGVQLERDQIGQWNDPQVRSRPHAQCRLGMAAGAHPARVASACEAATWLSGRGTGFCDGSPVEPAPRVEKTAGMTMRSIAPVDRPLPELSFRGYGLTWMM